MNKTSYIGNKHPVYFGTSTPHNLINLLYSLGILPNMAFEISDVQTNSRFFSSYNCIYLFRA